MLRLPGLYIDMSDMEMEHERSSVLLKATFPGIRLVLALIKFIITLLVCCSSPQMCGLKKDQWKKFANSFVWTISTHLLRKVLKCLLASRLLHTLFRA